MPASKLPKGSISRKNLRAHRIYYDETVYVGDDENGDSSDDSTSHLPDHVDALREALLDFSNTVPADRSKDFIDELSEHSIDNTGGESLLPASSAYFDPSKRVTRSLTAAIESNIESCEKAAQFVRKRRTADEESTWGQLLRELIFWDFDKVDTVRTETDVLVDRYCVKGDFPWNGCFDHNIGSDTIRRTDPRPDICYGFPAICTPKVAPKGFARDEYIESFSLRNLEELCTNHALRPTMTTGLRRWIQTKTRNPSKSLDDPTESHLLCYPWAVVEIKKPRASVYEVTECYCQAANGSAAALQSQHDLFAAAFEKIPKRMPPIICFTFIGARAKVWLTYHSKDSDGPLVRMTCIWSTSIETTWGILALRHMVKAMHFWSSRILKPKIVSALMRVRERRPTKPPLSQQAPNERSSVSLSLPVTPSSHSRRRSRSRSSSMQSTQHRRSPLPIRTARVEEDSTENESIDEEIESEDSSDYENDADMDNDAESRSSSYDSDDSDLSSTTSGAKNIRFDEQVFSSDEDTAYSPSSSSEMDSEYECDSGIDDEGSLDESSDDDELSDASSLTLHEGITGYRYTGEELEERRRLSLTILGATGFAELDVLDEWFSDVAFERQFDVIWKLVNPLHGGLNTSSHYKRQKERLQNLLDLLNKPYGSKRRHRHALTVKNITSAWANNLLYRSLFKLRMDAQALRDCFYFCLCLHNEKTERVYDTLFEFLGDLSVTDLDAMASQAFDLLNRN